MYGGSFLEKKSCGAQEIVFYVSCLALENRVVSISSEGSTGEDVWTRIFSLFLILIVYRLKLFSHIKLLKQLFIH